MTRRKPLNRPRIRVRTQKPDGSFDEREMSWEEAHGGYPEWLQTSFESTWLHNAFLSRESDRAVAVLAPAYLDSLLDRLLRQVFVEGKSAEALLDDNGALSTFSSHIDLVHALGLISDRVRRDLHLIRDIRNTFAHDVNVHSFEEARIAAKCLALYSGEWIIEQKKKDGLKVGDADARWFFLYAVGSISGVITYQAMRTAQRFEYVAPTEGRSD